jgi:hypothetical protein
MRIAEEALRRPILRGLGHLATAPLMEHTIKALEGPGKLHIHDSSFVFHASVGRGRIHSAARGEFVAHTDKLLRSIADTAFCFLQADKLYELQHTFHDISQQVRDFSAAALDHKLGKTWRDLDRTLVAQVKIDELPDGRKISRYDRHLLLKTEKPLDVHTSFGNGVATTAEFAAIGVEGMSRALSEAGCLSSDWYPHAFAHLNKISLGARLPFWSAQDFAIAANGHYKPALFRVDTGWPSTYHIRYAKDAHEKYVDKGITGDCQGIIQIDPTHITLSERRLREQFLRVVGGSVKKTLRAYIAQRDVPSALDITSVDAATALAVSIAYKGQYSL